MSAGRGISIVIPVHTGRAHLLEGAFTAFDAARRRLSEPSEVIVVDDSPRTESLHLEQACGRHAARYYRVTGSASVKRNAGARHASNDAVLFLDSDCTPTETLLVEHLAALRRAPPNVAAVVGTTEMYGRLTPTWRVANRSLMYSQCYRFPERYMQVTWAPTSNICFARRAFWRLGGFREDTYTSVGGEDVDIGVRACKSGYIFVTNPAAVALHGRDHITRLRQVAKSLYTYGRADVWLCSVHPDRRVRHLNRVALAGATGFLLAIVPRDLRRVAARVGAGLYIAGLAQSTWERYRQSGYAGPYRRLREEKDPPVPGRWKALLESLAAVVLDSSFDTGALVEAFRRRQLSLILTRFTYIDEVGFINRHPVTHTE